MSGDTPQRTSEGAGLEDIHEASDSVEQSTMSVTIGNVRERWRTAGAIVVLAATSVLLFRVDGGLSIDTQVFAGITLLLLLYFLVTLRSDVGME
ncbi:hypothetical protein [Halocatena salina]|uniref:Uncharacterized protein n=1 Tax=Halocatena salina TaxID=2934340 RepID=A0A8U0A4X5_9EURY|nr:hypothetical protein [Halocatena salina]UPM44260.1 hypothetical protein MW046_14700 [Halocatena salina]